MNWDKQINSILNATDSNVASIKQRLNPVRNFASDPLFDKVAVSKSSSDGFLDRPWNSCTICADRTHQGMSSEDLAMISSQLQSQTRTIASLNQAVKRLEKERDYQQERMQNLEEEVQRLKHSARDATDAALERRVEDLRRELSSDLRSLREQMLEIPDRGMAPRQPSVASLIEEVNESKRTVWKECESVRREIDHIKHKIRRQEEDLLQQIANSRESRRGHDRNSKMLEELLESHRSHSMDLNRTKSESQQAQLELQHIKTTISTLKDEMSKLHPEGSLRLPAARNERSRRNKTSRSKKSAESSSVEEDSARKLSLGDISSDDISSVLDFGTSTRRRGFQGASRTSSDLEIGIGAELDSDLEDNDQNEVDLSDDLEGLSDSAPELNLSDL